MSLFKPGDEVWYAGDITRPGCNAAFQLVDERIVGRKPKSLSFAEAAALPLTTITAYESFFDRLGIDRDGANKGESILIIGASGGVGSIGIQLAKHAGLTVIATASRTETIEWVKSLGADHVVNHREDIVDQVWTCGFTNLDHITIFNDMHQTSDMIEQHKRLSWVADEIDAGRLRTTVSRVLSPINAANLCEAHRLVETGKAKGKIVVEGF